MKKSSRESQIYLDFFSQNKWLIFIPTFSLAGTLFYYQLRQPATIHKSILFEASYECSNAKEQEVAVGEMIAKLRSAHLQKQLEVDKDSQVVIYKSGPLLLSVDMGNKNPQQVNLDLIKIKNYLQENFALKEVGEVIASTQKTSEVLFGLIGGAMGFLMGILISLIKTYFQKY